jgi:hypothetical protein
MAHLLRAGILLAALTAFFMSVGYRVSGPWNARSSDTV